MVRQSGGVGCAGRLCPSRAGMRFMAGRIRETGHKRRDLACLDDVRRRLCLGLQFPACRDSAYARLFQRFPGMNRLRKRLG